MGAVATALLTTEFKKAYHTLLPRPRLPSLELEERIDS
jgi:hypothetical protein